MGWAFPTGGQTATLHPNVNPKPGPRPLELIMKEALFRGVLIGGAFGIIATYVLHMDPPRAFFLGVVGGLLAGVTKYKIDQKRKK